MKMTNDLEKRLEEVVKPVFTNKFYRLVGEKGNGAK